MKEKFNTFVILGLQWGDEGKGNIISELAKDADYVVRYQGGNNAGHTVYLNDKKYTLDMLPLGILNTKGKCILGAGVSVNLDTFFDEISVLENEEKSITNIFIDGRAQLIMPYHNKVGKNKTSDNIAYCYMDKILKKGIRVSDLLNLETFSTKLMNNLKEKKDISNEITDDILNFEYIYSKYVEYAKSIKNIIIDSTSEINKAILEGKKILFESSESIMLDTTFGTYPDVSPNLTTVAGVCAGAGIPPKYINNIIGVFKAYSTRVDQGIFPTEIVGQDGNFLRNKGNEYVSKTGVARRCGWLDLVILRYACIINGITELCLTKLDVLSGLKKIKVAIGYEINERIYQVYPINYDDSKGINILYKEFEGWDEDITEIKEYEDLPYNCKRFVEYIEGYLETKITSISVGEKPDQTIRK